MNGPSRVASGMQEGMANRTCCFESLLCRAQTSCLGAKASPVMINSLRGFYNQASFSAIERFWFNQRAPVNSARCKDDLNSDFCIDRISKET